VKKPKITERPGIYSLTWEDQAIIIEVVRARQHNSDGRITGEVAVKAVIEGKPTLLHQAQFNFSSTTTREKLRKALEGRANGIDWYGIIEQLCYYVVEWQRRGEPVEMISTADNTYEPPQYLLEPALLEGHPNILYGEGGSGKTTLAELFALCILLPEWANPLGLMPRRSTTTPLILDWEGGQDMHGWNLGCMVRGMGLPHVEMPYRRCHRPLADDIEDITKAVHEHDAGCIIIDALGQAAGGDLNSTESPTRFFAALRSLKVSSIIIAHTSKDEQKRKTVYGNVHFTNYARNVWLVRKDTQDDPDEIRVGMFHRKYNYTGEHKPLAFEFQYGHDTITVQRTDIRDSWDIAVELSTGTRMLDLLRDGALKPEQVAKQLDVKPATVRQTCKRLKRRGMVVLLEDGRYGLPAFVGALS